MNIYFIADTIEQNSISTTLAKPKYGWKEFYEKIPYPIYAYNNSIESSFDLEIQINSNGDVTRIESYGNDDRTTFLTSVKRAIYSTKWEPATENGKKRKSSITIQMLYYIKRYDNPFPMIIEGERAQIINHTYYNSLTKDVTSKVDTLVKERDSIYYFNLRSQCCTEDSSPFPVLGFDTLRSLINPTLLLKYNLANTKLFNIYINEFGEIDSVYYTDYFQFLINNFINELQKLYWLPAKKNNKNIRSCLSLPLVFYSKDNKSVYPIIVEAIKCGAL